MKAVLEKIHVPEKQSLIAYHYEKPSFETPWHFHPEHELTYIKKSSGIRYVGNSMAAFEEGDLVLIASQLPHCWKNDEHYQSTSKALVIQWHTQLFHDIPELQAIHRLLKLAQRGISFSAVSAALVDKMEEVIEAPPLNKYLLLHEILDELANRTDYQLLAGDSYVYDHSPETSNRIMKVQQFVQQHYKQKIMLTDIAHELHMSEQSFSRFFSKVMQRSFFIYLNEYRINIASRMLLETDRQVAEIGFECGYESLPFFYKQFKKFKHCSPLVFRKMFSKAQH
ncbi:AraC family transcriptional regulator [Limibacter armeniacum]|uniref:AraC family transcriptional regulator n=1 Tax=Limibacter armeniacum TaxID=466084 RepID=UPI002FE6C23C